MKILIIADNLGKNAPGFVFYNLLRGLAPKIDFDIITSTLDTDVNSNGNIYYLKSRKLLPSKISRLLFIIFGFNIIQYLWAKQAQKYVKKTKYDVVISLMSYSFYASVMAASFYCRKYNVRHICYCVDAVPAPFPWEVDGIYKNAIKRFVKKYLSDVDVLAMTNKEMLSYELSIIGSTSVDGIVIPNPPQYHHLMKLDDNELESSFVFAGKIYGIRNPQAMIDGFDMFLKSHPESKFYFLGSNIRKEDLMKYGCANIENYIFIDYTRDLKPIFSKCIGLIDINANIDNDVFLSSKVLSYLPYNRLIISESGENSPVRSIFKDSKTLIHVKHNKYDYLRAFEYCYDMQLSVDFHEREDYLSQFNMNAVAQLLISKLK